MKRALTFVFVLGFSCCLYAQAVDTTVCEILKNPQSFNGKIVRVKGTAVASFDQFAVKGTGCETTINNNIWLSYPEGTKAKAGPAVMVHVQPAHNFAGEVPAAQRTPVELDKSSKDFKQFDSLLATPFKKGGMCLGCNRYEVTATLVGRLDAVEDATLRRDKTGKIISFGGFGHMNAYSARLVLQSVSDVTPKEIDYSQTLAATKEDVAPDQLDPDPLATAQKLAAAYSATEPAGQQFKRAVGVFPKPKEYNGVVILHANGNDAAAKYETKGTVDSPDGLLFTCTINASRLSGDAESRAFVFAGENIANLRIPLPEGLDAGIYDLESRAWTTTTLDAVGSRQKTMTLPGAYLVWNSAWTPAEINKNVSGAIEGFLSKEEILHK
jgi:hypothetical protein